MTMLATITTLTLQEYKMLETTALSTAQALTLRDHFSNYLKIEPVWGANAWRLTASHYVGVIVLDDLHIVIHPKTRVENLFFMLTYAYDLPEFRAEETLLTLGEDIFEFIVTIFLNQLQRLIRQGLQRSYIEQNEQQPYLRGRLLLADHLRQQATHQTRLPQRTNAYTADVLENQILKYTLWLLAQLNYQDLTLPNRLRHTYHAFAEVTHTVVNAAACCQVHITRLNQRYRTPLNLAALLLRHLSLEGGRGHERFGAYLFNMNEVFEQFVGRYLQAYFQHDPAREVVLQDHIWLDAERQEKGIPDIVLRHNGQPTYVLDTKYKPFKGSPDPSDRNQMWIYTHSLGAGDGMLIYPAEQPIVYHTTFKGIPLRATGLPLVGTLAHFKAECQRFAEQFA